MWERGAGEGREGAGGLLVALARERTLGGKVCEGDSMESPSMRLALIILISGLLVLCEMEERGKEGRGQGE